MPKIEHKKKIKIALSTCLLSAFGYTAMLPFNSNTANAAQEIGRYSSYEIPGNFFSPLISSNSVVESNMPKIRLVGTAASLAGVVDDPDKGYNFRNMAWDKVASYSPTSYNRTTSYQFQRNLDNQISNVYSLGPREIEDARRNPGKYYVKIKNVGKINGKDVDLKVSIMGLGAVDEKTDSYDLHSHNENADRMMDFIERNKITNDFFSIRLPGENLNADTPQETFGTLAIDTTRSSVLNYSYIYSDGTPVKNEDGLISAGFDDVDWTQNITLKNSELIAYSKGSHILSPVSNSNNTSTFNSKPGEGNNGVDEGIFWGLYKGASGNASVTFDFNSATPDRNNFPRTRWQERMLEKLDKSI